MLVVASNARERWAREANGGEGNEVECQTANGFAREDRTQTEPARQPAAPARSPIVDLKLRPRSHESADDGSSPKTMKSAFVLLALLVATASAQCDVQSLISTNEGYATCVCTFALSYFYV